MRTIKFDGKSNLISVLRKDDGIHLVISKNENKINNDKITFLNQEEFNSLNPILELHFENINSIIKLISVLMLYLERHELVRALRKFEELIK